MKVKLQIMKNGTLIYGGTHDVTDADSFGKACSDAWLKLRQERLDQENSIGALFEHLDDNVINQLDGAHISLEMVR